MSSFGIMAARQTQRNQFEQYPLVSIDPETHKEVRQNPATGDLVTYDPVKAQQEPWYAGPLKALVYGGLGAGFGAAGLAALGGGGSGILGGLGLGGSADAAGGLASPIAAQGSTLGLGGGGAVALGSDGIPAVVTGAAASGGGLGAGGAAALGGLAGAGIGGAIANVGSPGDLSSNFSYPSSSSLTSTPDFPDTIDTSSNAGFTAAGAGGLGGLGSALNTAGQLATVGGVASGLLGSGNSASSIDPNLLNLILQNYSRAQGIANQPYQPYTGQLSAGLNPTQQQAGAMYQNLPNAGASTLNSAIGNAQPSTIAQGMDTYKNPYQQDVINTTLADLDRQRQMAISQGQGAATQSGAYGGSRHGVADSLTNEAYGRIGAQTSAQLNQQGFNTAANLSGQDIGNRLQSAGLLGQLGQQQFGNAQTSANSILGYGTLGQQTDQAALDRQLQQFQAAQQWPFQTQALTNQSLGLANGASGSQVPGGQYAGLSSLFGGANALGTALFGNTSTGGGLIGSLFGGRS